MSLPQCTICEAPWRESCEAHPVQPYLKVARTPEYAAGYRAGVSRAARLAAAVRRNPELAASYGIREVEP